MAAKHEKLPKHHSSPPLPAFSWDKLTLSKVKDLVVTNYGDAAAILCSVLILGYVWRFTSPVFAPFVVFSHNVTDGSSGQGKGL